MSIYLNICIYIYISHLILIESIIPNFLLKSWTLEAPPHGGAERCAEAPDFAYKTGSNLWGFYVGKYSSTMDGLFIHVYDCFTHILIR